ncbi:MAG: NAD(P)H-dependent oxidoreductase [Deltaproteobacteria bacterium]|nr:NAD(P)H-dependent oxidoreductase [Deltaproteobacteria bacterium]
MSLLILYAHPASHRSRLNRRLLAEALSVPGVLVHDLYEEYPDFHIEVRREQELLVAHDTVVFQHPFYWYSVPALLKQWMDLVLKHGWAYGKGGTALQGKRWLTAVTTGGPEAAYQEEGANRFTMRQLLAPLEQTARLCGMEFLEPFITHAAHRISDADLEAQAHAYRKLLASLLAERSPRAEASMGDGDEQR